MQRTLFSLAIASLLGTGISAQDLLVNGSFDEPAGASCQQQNGVAVPGWTGLAKLNGDLYVPACPRAGDGSHASVQGWGPPDPLPRFYQTVDGVEPGTTYTFGGVWWIGCMDANGSTTVRAELRDGAGPDSPLIASVEQVKRGAGDTGQWLAFSTNGAPTDSQMTVVITVAHQGATGWALHCDACVLSEAVCVDPPSIASVEPPWGSRGDSVEVTITGANFKAGATTAKLTKLYSPDIAATNLVVAGDGTSMTCAFDLTGAALGRWNLVVSASGLGCADAVLPTGFLVVLDAFTNGSFELPDPGNAGCVDGTPNEKPTEWLVSEVVAYGWARALSRDETGADPPTCPPPDGSHYASSWSDTQGGAGAEARIYQTIAVTLDAEYTVAARFAGTGGNTVYLELLDGDESAPPLAATTVHSGGGAYDWTAASATGTPTTGLITVQWRIVLEWSGPPRVACDAFVIATGNPAPTLSVDPPSAALTLCGPSVSLALTATAEDAGGDPLSYLWSASGGAAVTPDDPPSSATAVSAAVGDYTVTCAVSDGLNVVKVDVPVAVTECAAATNLLIGDANCDKQANIADAICTLAYLFGQAGDPCKTQCCAANEDTNHDRSVNIADAVMLLTYLFGGGNMIDPSGNPIAPGSNVCKPYAQGDVTLPCATQCTP